jgi:dsDNA-specific endonuclease/ATPase MutS2
MPEQEPMAVGGIQGTGTCGTLGTLGTIGTTSVMDDPVRVPIEGTLDLHAFHPRDVRSVVADYIEAAHEAGLGEVRLIHGRGKGIQRGIVHAALDANPLVDEFWDAPETHLGATIARLKPR